LFKLAFSNIKLSLLAIIVLTLLSFNNSCYAFVNTTDNAEMVWVPGATFTMGNDWFEFPKHQVTLSGYWIYKYEVTVAKYRAFCTATGHALPTFPTGYSWTNKSWTTAGLQQHPIVNVSWNDAKAYADWANVSLPTEAQWEYAASGPAKNNYPWGGTAIIDDYYNGWDDLKCANYRNCEIKNISTKAVGSFPTGASWCGAQDMAGNVWEWCSDYWDLYNEVTTTNPTGPTTGDTRVLRGGSWSGDAEGSTRTANRLNDSQGDFTPLFGFRCVSNTVGPLTAVTLAISPDTQSSVGTPITLTATPNGGSAGVQYKFMNGTTMLQDFTTNKIFTWIPTNAGAATLTVVAKDTDTTTVTSSIVNITINPILSDVTLSALPVNSVGLGATVTLTATSTGGTTVQYKFMNGTNLLRDFTANNTYSWTPETAGVTSLTVIATDGATTITSPVVNYTINPALTAVNLTTLPLDSIAFGLPVTLTATATGGTGVQYKFMHDNVMLRDFAVDNTFTWTPDTAGVTSLTVVATDDNDTITSPAITITVNPALTAVSISSSANATDIGTAIKLTATATGGTDVQYKFMNGDTMLRDFTTDDIFDWTPATAGEAVITVIAKDNNVTLTSTAIYITINPVLSAVSLSTSPVNSVAFGLPITLTATPTGGVNLQYQFMSDTTILCNFSSSNAYTFTPTVAKKYSFTVIAKDLCGVDTTATKTSTVVNLTVYPVLTTVSVSTLPLNTAALGTPVTITAMATGGVNVQYQFMTGTTVLRTFNSSNTYTFTPGTAKTYSFTIIAKDLGGINPTVTVTSSPVTLVIKPVLSAVSVTPDNTSPWLGSSITFTATATGGASVQYQFLMDGNTTSPLRDFAAGKTCQWTAVAGTHIITVIARDINGNPGITFTANKTIKVKVALISVTISTTQVTTAALGTSVTLAATATGGVNLQYKFMTGTTILRSFSSSKTYTFTPAFVTTYNFTVIAKDLGGIVTTDTVQSGSVTLAIKPVLTAILLKTTPASSVMLGLPVTLTATANGGANVQYKFMDGTTQLRGYETGNTFTYTPTAAKTYSFNVIACDLNSITPTATKTAGVSFIVKPPLTAVSLKTAPTISVSLGLPVTLTVTATGGANVHYQFMTGTTILRSFSRSNTYTFTPAIAKNYSFTAIAKDTGGIVPTATVTSPVVNLTVK
jgi:formylglycine-generating enzyme required for sulfatase activity